MYTVRVKFLNGNIVRTNTPNHDLFHEMKFLPNVEEITLFKGLNILLHIEK